MCDLESIHQPPAFCDLCDRKLTEDEDDVCRPCKIKAQKARYIVAFYHVDQAWGGPEEGGWYYGTGSLLRISRVFKNDDAARRYCRRANDLLHFMQRDRPSIYHTNSEGRIEAEVHEDFAPQGYPNGRPHYE